MLMRLILAAAAVAAAMLPARAQETYPSKSITMIVPFAAGGASDVVARVVGDEMMRNLGQTIIYENIAGAGGTIALARAAAARPDGYTIAIGNAGTNAASYTLFPEIKFAPDAFIPIGLLARTSAIIALRKDFPAKSIAEFLDVAKKDPKAVRLGHAGVGSSNYLICLSFLSAINLDLTLVGYRGGGPALNDAIGGHIDGVCDAAPSVASSIQGGQVKGLVLASAARMPQIPDVPTATEAGVPGFTAGGWNALFAPKGTPDAIVAKLNASIRAALATDQIKKRFEDLSSTMPRDEELSPQFLGEHVPREIEKYKKLLEGRIEKK
jgi:tripartite-type tricarboxylate transporter receptor subunit TctC